MSKTGDTTMSRAERAPSATEDDDGWALVVAWSRDEPWRAGESARLGDRAGEHLVGRGGALTEDPFPRLLFQPARPGVVATGQPLGGAGLSRRQLRVKPVDGGLRVENVGKSKLLVDGASASTAVVRRGQTLLIEDELLLFVTRRPAEQRLFHAGAAEFAFGKDDPHGFVGEGPAMWRLRDRVAFVARASGHVLVTGESGAGKELVARAIHGASARGARLLVSRNAATFPATLADAELFGHARDYPQAGMPERPGLVAQADGSTLFLDELGELDEAVQAKLLRALDSGEFQRLGDARARRADVRVVGATNRGEASLKHDLAARFPLRVDAPSLDERREDVPLLVAHLLRRIDARDPGLLDRFRSDAGHRVEARLVERLLRHPFTHHVRELEGILWLAIGGSERDAIALTTEVDARLRGARAAEPLGTTPVDDGRGPAISKDAVRAALDANGGNQARAYKALGLDSRDQLYRLIKKYRLEPKPR